MLRTMDDLEDYSVGRPTAPSPGEGFYFDDEFWVVRYFLVEAGAWLAGRKVLISTTSIRAPNWFNRLLPVSMTRQEVAERQISRRSGHARRPSSAQLQDGHLVPHPRAGRGRGTCLRLPHRRGNWAIRYLIVDTRNWWLGHHVLIAPEWIVGLSWDDHTVSVTLTRDAVRNAPPYRAKTQFDRDAK